MFKIDVRNAQTGENMTDELRSRAHQAGLLVRHAYPTKARARLAVRRLLKRFSWTDNVWVSVFSPNGWETMTVEECLK